MNGEDAFPYCWNGSFGGLTGWRLPEIDELVSLIRGCVNGVESSAASTSSCEMTPSGCLSDDTCTGLNFCDDCDAGGGPDGGSNGCYWDPALSGACSADNSDGYWSASPAFDYQWYVKFYSGSIISNTPTWSNYYVRCVRDGD